MSSNPANMMQDPRFWSDPQSLKTEKLQGQGWRDVLAAGLLTLGAGAAARGGVGMFNLARRNKPRPKPLPNTAPGLAKLDLEEEEEEGALKAAEGGWLSEGWSPENVQGLPFYYPAMMTAGLGGGFAGWKAMDMLLDKRRESEQDDELDNAKANFQKALMSSTSKTAEESSELGRELDNLYDNVKSAMDAIDTAEPEQLEKLAGIGQVGGQAAGAALLLSLLTGGLGFRYGYGRASRSAEPNILNKALKRRQRMRSQNRPFGVQTEISLPTAKPKPAPLKKPAPVSLDEEEDEDPLAMFDTPAQRQVTRLAAQ